MPSTRPGSRPGKHADAKRNLKDSFRLFLALLLPPAAVAHRGGLKRNFWINCGLTLIFYVPGAIHAVLYTLGRRQAA